MNETLKLMASIVDVKNRNFELAYVLASPCGKLVATDTRRMLVVDNAPIWTPECETLLEVKKISKPIFTPHTIHMNVPAITSQQGGFRYPDFERIVPSREKLKELETVALELDADIAICQIAQAGYFFKIRYIEDLYKTKLSLNNLTLHKGEGIIYITGMLGDANFIYIIMPIHA